ncbi:MAG: cell envelope biosis protein AsmA [Tardiphaga sp.]|nr:cell envelope biosis protein AsmA [Tardiphaga sp.]
MRALKIAGAVLAALIVVVAVLLTIGVPSGFVTSAIQARIERETGYRIVIAGATRVGLWPSLNVTVHDVTVVDLKDRDVSDRLTLDSVQADIPLQSLLSGHPQVTELAIVRPVLRVPLLRERTRRADPAPKPTTTPGDANAKTIPVGHVTVTDGAVVFSNPHDRVEIRIDGINAGVRSGADRRIDVTGSARMGEQPLKFEITAAAPAILAERQNIPVEMTFEAPGLLRQPLSSKAEVRLNGSVLMINGLSGTFGDGQFNGWASADLASKPLVKVDLDFQRLDIGASSRGASVNADSPQTDSAQTHQTLTQPWSNEKIDLSGLNYVDAQIRVSAAELNVGDARFAPAAVDATLGSGVLKATFSHLGVYSGEADGELGVDVRTSNPAYTLRTDLVGVRALPLLSTLADFDKLDGKMQAKISVRSSGTSQRAILSGLDGSAFVNFQDGAIRGLNVAKMIRALTTGTLSGWQEGKDETTDLTQLGASFRLERGQATTGDLALVGPLVRMSGTGTVDIANKSLALRVEPKLVMTLQGQGGATDPVGLGIPVVMQGPWSAPTIYPDMAGILDNPDATYAKLREMGKGLFGALGSGSLGGGATGSGPSDALGGGLGGSPGGSGAGGAISDQLGGKLGETLGALIQQGLGATRSPAIQPPQAPQAAPQASPQDAPAKPVTPPDEQSPMMNDILKQLFGR